MSRRRLHQMLALGLTVVFLLPLYWMVIASLRPPGLPPARSVEWWPKVANWANYATIFQMVPMARYITNSLLVVSVALPVTWLTASTAGFALAQLPYPHRRLLLTLSIVLLMIPGASVWFFRYRILRWLGLIDSLWALIVPAFAASSPLFVLLYYHNYRRVPAEVFDAARLDGAGVLTIWWQIARPLARPTSVAVTLLAFVMYWSDFLSPVLYVYRPRLYTLPVGLQILKQLDVTNWPLLMAAACVAILPVAVLFALLQGTLLGELSLADLMERY